MSAVHGINSLRPITVYHERREHACVPRRHAGRRHLPDGIHAPVQPVHKPRPVCAQSHGRKCESGSRRRFEPASAESNVDCHDIHAIAAEPDGFRSQFTFPGVGPQHGSHAIAVEIDSRPQVVMAIRLNEALRASVGSTDAPNRVLDASVCRTDARKVLVNDRQPHNGAIMTGMTRQHVLIEGECLLFPRREFGQRRRVADAGQIDVFLPVTQGLPPWQNPGGNARPRRRWGVSNGSR